MNDMIIRVLAVGRSAALLRCTKRICAPGGAWRGLVVVIMCCLSLGSASFVQAAATDLTNIDPKPVIYPQLGHSDLPRRAVFSADGRQVISVAAKDSVVKIWDVESGRELRSLQNRGTDMASISASADGRFLASGSEEGVRIWDFRSGRVYQDFDERSVAVRFSPDSQRLLIVDRAGIVMMYEIRRGAFAKIWQWSSGELRSVTVAEFSHDGRKLFVGKNTGEVLLINGDTGKKMQLIAHMSKAVLDVRDCGAGRWVVLSTEEGHIHILSNGTWRQLHAVESVDNGQVACSRHDSWVVGVLSEKEGREKSLSYEISKAAGLFDIETGNFVRLFESTGRWFWVGDVSPDGQFLVGSPGLNIKSEYPNLNERAGVFSDLRTLAIWNLATLNQVRSFSVNTEMKRRDYVSAKGTYLGSITESGRFSFWNLMTGKHTGSLERETDLWNNGGNITISESGIWIGLGVVHDKASLIRLLNTVTWEEMWQSKVAGTLSQLTFSSDDRQIIAVTENSAHHFDVDTGTLVRSTKALGITRYFGKWKVVIEENGRKISVVDANSERLVMDGQFLCDSMYFILCIKTFSFSTDGKRLLIGTELPNSPGSYERSSGEYRFELWDLGLRQKSDTRSASLRRNLGASVPMSSGQHILSAIGGDLVQWELSSGRVVKTISGYSEAIQDLYVLPGDQAVASTHENGTIRLWNLVTGENLVTFADFFDNEWIAITPEGYYASSARGDAALNVRISGKVYGIDQFRPTFYRPEIVEATLRLGNRELVLRPRNNMAKSFKFAQD